MFDGMCYFYNCVPVDLTYTAFGRDCCLTLERSNNFRITIEVFVTHKCKMLFLHTRPAFLWTRPGLGNVVLHGGCKATRAWRQYDNLTSLLTSWRHFHVRFRQTFRRQRRRQSRTELFLIEKCRYFSVNLTKQDIFKSKCNCRRKSMQEKDSIMVLRCKLKIPSLG